MPDSSCEVPADRPRHRLQVAAALALTVAPPLATAQAQPPAPPSLLPIVLALAVVLAAIPVAIWLLKRLGAGGAPPLAGLQVVGQMPLGAGQRLVVVQAGSRWLLLGVTGSSITRLGTLPRPAGDADGTGAAAPAGFAALLARAARGAGAGR